MMQTLAFTTSSVAVATDILLRGGVVILPTDTVYGVACHPDFPDALERIRKMKGRDASKPFQLLVASPADVWARGAVRSTAAERLATHWAGALTLVLPMKEGGDEGFRVPDLPLLQDLLRACGGTLRCTSVNLSGEPPAKDALEAGCALGDAVDLILDGGPAMIGCASTVARVSTTGEITVLREGSIRLD